MVLTLVLLYEYSEHALLCLKGNCFVNNFSNKKSFQAHVVHTSGTQENVKKEKKRNIEFLNPKKWNLTLRHTCLKQHLKNFLVILNKQLIQIINSQCIPIAFAFSPAVFEKNCHRKVQDNLLDY